MNVYIAQLDALDAQSVTRAVFRDVRETDHRRYLQEAIDTGKVYCPGQYAVALPSTHQLNIRIFEVETVPKPALRIKD